MSNADVDMQTSNSSISNNTDGSRPGSPTDSLMTNSLYRATATVDELTQTLAKVSRAPSPDCDEDFLLSCCCGREDCGHLKAWTAFQAKLENRLILCAEVGQALLEKHEAYVRRHAVDDEGSDTQSERGTSSRPETPTLHASQHDSVIIAELRERNQSLEKRLNAALVDAEVADNGKKALHEELDELKGTLSKLAINQARSTGWETRLTASEQDRDDLQQELDAERQRSRTAELQVNSLKERCEKMQLDMNKVLDEANQHRQTRTELSEEILRDARARLAMVQQQRFGHNVIAESQEVTEVMESLVADNEALKRDVAELQNYLTDSREEVRMLRDEVEESRAFTAGMQRTASAANKARHNHAQSWASSFGRAPLSPPLRSSSVSSQSYEPLTPNTQARPLSPVSQAGPSESRQPPITSPKPKYPSALLNLEGGERSQVVSPEFTEQKSPRKPLLLLTQSRGVQTDDVQWSSLFGSVFRPRLDDASSYATPPGGEHSESSSMADTQAHASTIAFLVDKTSKLFTRMAQADALTLTNRLKRQRLAGDVSHLSHTTVSTILSEANGLRSHFRAVLEDERAISTCTRRDLRALISLMREIFVELGQMRIALNDVILDPSLAPKLREVAMDPTKGLDAVLSARNDPHGTNASGWMAPLSKLFGGVVASTADDKPTPRKASTPISQPENTPRSKASKFVPKSGPALAATATTVNVEFSGSGVGRSTTSNVPPPPPVPVAFPQTDLEDKMERSKTPMPRPTMGAGGTASSRAVMDIFAGAPNPSVDSSDPWIILPSAQKPRKQQSVMDMRSVTLDRSSGRWATSTNEAAAHRLPRNVDAVVDVDSTSAILDEDEEEEDMPNLLERTLRPRGLSDSSIRSSTLVDEPGNPAGGLNAPMPTPVSPMPSRIKRNSIRMTGPTPIMGGGSVRQGAWPGAGVTRTSVFQAFSRAFTIPAFTSPPPSAATTAKTAVTSTFDSAPSGKAQSHSHSRSPSTHSPETLSSSPSTTTPAPSSRRPKNIIPSLAAHWAGLDAAEAADFVGSVRRENGLHGLEDDLNSPMTRRGWSNRDLPGREL